MSGIAILGGSFNPPHLAHQMICLWALSTGKTQQIWLLPTYVHPLQKTLIAFEHRLSMCSLATALFSPELVKVSDVEAHLGSPSLTINTLEYLIKTNPQHHFRLMVGADILHEKESWYRFDEIERLAPLIVIGRDGYAGPPETAITLPRISSTQIRKLLSQGQDVSALLPKEVLAYIREHDLYC